MPIFDINHQGFIKIKLYMAWARGKVFHVASQPIDMNKDSTNQQLPNYWSMAKKKTGIAYLVG